MKTEMIYSKRGLLNKLNVWVFYGFHIVMAIWMLSFLGEVGSQADTCVGEYADACMAGTGLGGMIGTGFLASIWFVFGMIGGIIVYITRPKIIGTKTKED